MGYLRILLALAVASGHLQSQIFDASSSTIISVGPVVAVKLFFVISGFYMAMVFGNYPTAASFFASRAARLYPIYWIVVVLCIAATAVHKSPSIPPFLHLSFWSDVQPPLPLLIYWLSNLSFIGLDLGIFFCERFVGGDVKLSLAQDTVCAGSGLAIDTSIVQPAWTLALEVYFYLMVPFLARSKTRTSAWLALASFVIALGIAFFHNRNPWHRSFFPAELYLFLAGFISFRLRQSIPKPVGYSCAIVTVVTVLAYQHLPFLDWSDPAGLNILIYPIFAISLPVLFSAGSRLPIERIVGDLSYPIYISHALTESLIFTAELHSRWHLSLNQWIALNLSAVLMVAAGLLLVTWPIERIRHLMKSTHTRGHPVMSHFPNRRDGV
jgi:peptidoglycan/LPS O-acetylase OafA/YrhL